MREDCVFFDTAPLYGHGLSERRIGQVLGRYPRASFLLSTKVGRLLRTQENSSKIDRSGFAKVLPFEPVFDYSYDGVRYSVEASLERLHLERIDVLLIHDVDTFTHGEADLEDRFREAMKKGAYRALQKLRSEGTVKAIGAGLSEWETCYRFAREGDFDCFLLAGRYTLLEQTALEPFLCFCRQRRISIIIGGPYNSGILVTGPAQGAKYNYAEAPPEILEKTSRIEELCNRHGVPLAAAALQFPMGHPAVSTVIPGAQTMVEVERNIELFNLGISENFWVELKERNLIREDAPVPKG